MTACLQDLPFDPARLGRLSRGLITSHHQHNYTGTMNPGAHRHDPAPGRQAPGPDVMSAAPTPRVALLYPGDRVARDRADPAASRFAALFDAPKAAGVAAEPAVYHDDLADEVMAQLRSVQLVLVWCNPIEASRRRDRPRCVASGSGAQGSAGQCSSRCGVGPGHQGRAVRDP